MLNAGKGLYIENPDLGFAHGNTQFYQMLGATFLGDGNPYVTGNIQSVTGQPGTFVAGMNYNYMFQQIPDNYVDFIGSNGGTILFRSQENYGRAICYGGPTNTYRSIYSTFNLGALRNGANTKLQLVTKYMEYLLRVGVGENNKEHIVQKFIVTPNPASEKILFSFTLDKNQKVRIKIYDTAGRMIKTIIDRELNQGAHNFLWNLSDESGKKLSVGTYIMVFETDAGIETKTIVVIK